MTKSQDQNLAFLFQAYEKRVYPHKLFILNLVELSCVDYLGIHLGGRKNEEIVTQQDI